jgi:hypothetical protein
MKRLKISLKDNDYVVRASTEIGSGRKNNGFGKFLKDINRELIAGETAHLEIESPETGHMTFEISRS